MSWDSLGDGKASEIPKTLPVGKITGAEKARIANYQEWVDTLDSYYEGLSDNDRIIVGIPDKAGDLCDEGRAGLRTLIGKLNELAKVNPKDVEHLGQLLQDRELDASIASEGGEITEDKYVMTVVLTTTTMATAAMQDLSNQFQSLAREIRPPAEQTPAPKDAPSTKQVPTNTTGTDGVSPYSGPYVGPVGDATSTDSLGAPPVWNWDSGSAQSSPFVTSAGSPSGLTARSSDSTATEKPSITAQAGNTSSAGTAAPAGTSSATPTPGFSPANYALPLAMQGLANMADARRAAGTATPENVGSASTRAAPGMVTAPASESRAASAGTSSAGVRSGQTSQNPPSATSSQAGTPPTSNHAGSPPAQSRPGPAQVTPVSASRPADGVMVYTFPDGRSQVVSPVVAQALDAAFGNAAGTDARHAYEKTAAKLPEGKEIGDPVDPSRLITGDIATWDQRTAVVVAFGDDGNTSLEVIVQGELKQFDAHMSDKQGDFGGFTGFAHPAGIEATSDSQPPAPAIPVDYSAGGHVSVPA
ncbi:hypothetical protein [Nocardia africana]